MEKDAKRKKKIEKEQKKEKTFFFEMERWG